MPKRLYLHIGRPKTGSTAIQAFLAANTETFKRHGYAVARTGYFFNSHGPLAWVLYKEAAQRFGYGYWKLCSQWALDSEMRPDLWAALAQEIQASPLNNFIVTTEELGILSTTLNGIQELLKAYLAGIDVRVIVYVRRQDEFLQSVYNQAVKGAELSFSGTFQDYWDQSVVPSGKEGPNMPARDRGLDHHYLCEHWAQIFGIENVLVRPFERQQLSAGLHVDFLRAIGIESDDGFVAPAPDLNPALSAASLEAMRRLNAKGLDADVRVQVLSRLQAMDSRTPGARYHSVLSPQERLKLVDHYRDGNRRLATDFLGREDGRLFLDPEPCASDVWDPLSPAAVALTLEMLGDILPTDDLLADLGNTKSAVTLEGEAVKEPNGPNAGTPDPREVPVGVFEKTVSALCSRREFSNSDHFKLLEHRISEFQAGGGQILSFDVFDTFLLRNDKSEARRYLELAFLTAALADGKPEASPGQALDHYVARNLGLEMSYRARPAIEGCREGHIEEVLRSQCRILNLPETRALEFHEVELNYEVDNITANRPLIEIAQRFASSGGRVILVSDIYLPAADIERLCLDLVGDIDFIQRIYSSADVVLSKRSGRIFGLVEQDFNLAGRCFLHVGDSLEGDVRSAKHAGWQAQHFPVADSELRIRLEDLAATISHIGDLGFDASRWAKL